MAFSSIIKEHLALSMTQSVSEFSFLSVTIFKGSNSETLKLAMI